jgi:transcriptional regulator with XRE-family HTH domain
MKGVSVPITPCVLAWAIEESGYSLGEVAGDLHVPVETVSAWVSGSEQPTLTKFRQLAALLKRTPSALLLPKPPSRAYPRVKFRHRVGDERSELNPSERRFIREAARVQRILSWVIEEIGQEAPRLPLADINADAAELLAPKARSSLAVTDDAQTRWKSSSQAFDAWRAKLEERGVLIFALPL